MASPRPLNEYEKDAKRRPAVPLYDYQKRWIYDPARFLIALITRQGGKSFGSTLKIALEMQRGNDWLLLSAGERQSKELMRGLQTHLRAINFAADIIEDTYRGEDETEYQMLTITLPNGARAIGLPANPDTARGWSMNVYLDEFAFHRDSRAVWAALFGTITRGYKIMITSTLNGKKNQFWTIVSRAQSGEGPWVLHQVDIYEAVEQGLVLADPEAGGECTPEDLRLALGDEEIWQQEYLLQASDELDSWLTYDLISTCEDVKAIRTPAWAQMLIEAAQEAYVVYRQTGDDRVDFSHIVDIPSDCGDLYVGMDVARKKHLSVIWMGEEKEHVLHPAGIIDMQNTPFWVQDRVLDAILRHPRVRRTCIDATGLGAQLAESAQDRHGEYNVEAVTMSGPVKSDLAHNLKSVIEDRRTRIPIDRTIRNSLHALKRSVTAAGNERFDAEASDEIGHADHFWALALAEHARDNHTRPAAGSDIDPDDGAYHTDRPTWRNRMRDWVRGDRVRVA